MSILPIKKIHILGHRSIQQDMVDFLYQSGVIEIIQETVDMEKEVPVVDISKLQEKLSQIDYAINYLEKNFPDKKKNVSIDKKEFNRVIDEFDYTKIYNQCRNSEIKFAELNNSKEKLSKTRDLLLPWISLDIKMSELKGTETTDVISGSISSKLTGNLIKEIKGEIYCEFWRPEVSSNKKNQYLILLCPKRKTVDLKETLKKHGFVSFVFPPENCSVSNYINNVQYQIVQIDMQIQNLKDGLKKILHLKKDLMILYDYYYNLKIKNLGYDFIKKTKETFYLCGWITSKNTTWLKKKIVSVPGKFSAVDIYFTDPLPDEDVPVFLQNNKITEPFNFVTELYGHPVYKGIDPTPLMALFFAVFFGFCLGDAGYGLIITLISIYVLKKHKLSSGTANFLKLMLFCGISTIFFGAITGGWFGDILDRVPSSLAPLKGIKNSLIIEKINPSTQPLNFLILALIFGTIQILFGLITNFYYHLKAENRFFAFFQQLPTILIQIVLLSLILVFSGLIPSTKKIFIILSSIFIVSAISIAITQWRINKGIVEKIFMAAFSNYSIVTGNFLSDTLSYSRLFALGLATGLMAMAVNELAAMVSTAPYVGIILLIIFLTVGHSLNILINMLGAYVHTSRLQYFEFFSKFYVSGGRFFKPFGQTNKYTIIE